MASRGTGSHLDSDKTTCTQPNYACFESTRVLVCGYSAEEHQELKTAIEAGGGRTYTKLIKGQLPQIIVCGSAADKAYRDVRKQAGGSNVPAVSKQWVEECNRAKGQVPYTGFEVKALTGLIISITNFDALERGNLQQSIEQYGGVYTAELYKDRCTHLICKTAAGPKYKAAITWRTMHVVNEAWLHASIKLGYPAPEDSHQPHTGQPLGKAASAPALAATTAAQARAATAPSVLPSITGAANSNDSWAAGSSGGPVAVAASGQQQQQQQQQQDQAPAAAAASGRATHTSSRTRSSSMVEPAVAAAAPAAAANHQQQVHVVPPVQHQQQQHVAAVQAAAPPVEQIDPGIALAARYAPLYDEGQLFLERVQLWWCGVSLTEQAELRHILFAFGGVWLPKLNQNVTHLMVGSQATGPELLEVKQYLQSCNRKIDVVSPAWLHFCMNERQLVTDHRGRMALTGLLSHVALGSTAAASTAAADPAAVTAAGNVSRGVFAQSASRSGFPDADQQQQQEGWVPEYWLHRPRDVTKLFEGCHFTLAALKGRQKEHEEALERIRTYGGQIFNHGSSKPPVSCPTVFAVCPASLTPVDERQLMAVDSSFRAVHQTCRVTVDWLGACVANRGLVRINDVHTPLFAPIRNSLPLPGFDKVSVVVSGYTDADAKRKTIIRLAELLGAKVLPKLVKTNPPTHLVIPRWGPDPPGAAGEHQPTKSDELGDLQIKKIRFAQKHNVEMVDSFWLAECMNDGKRVDEQYNRPLGDVELLPAGGGATQAGGASQLPQTQTGQGTQASSAVVKQGSAPAGVPRPRPSSVPGAADTAAAAAAAGGVGVTGNRPGEGGNSTNGSQQASNWFTAGASKVNQPAQQQQQTRQALPPQPHAGIQQQQQQQQRHREDPPLKRSLRKLLDSPGKADLPDNSEQQQQEQQCGKVIQQQQQQQQQQVPPVAVHPARHVASTIVVSAGVQVPAALADVGNTLQSSPPGLANKAADLHVATAVSAAATAVVTTTAGVQQPAPVLVQQHVVTAAAAVKTSPLLVGSDGDEDPALMSIVENLKAFASKHDIADGSCASQAAVPDMPSLQELTGRVGSGGPAAAAGSGGNGGASGYSLRGKRKGLGMGGSLGSGGGKGSGTCGSGGSDPDQAVEGDKLALADGPAKRPRRSNAAAAAAAGAAMPPPAARPAGKGGAGAVRGRGNGGSRYCPRKGGATQEPIQMSQQVDYDVGQHPEALLAAAGKRRSQTAAADEKAKTAMLARVGQLSRKQT